MFSRILTLALGVIVFAQLPACHTSESETLSDIDSPNEAFTTGDPILSKFFPKVFIDLIEKHEHWLTVTYGVQVFPGDEMPPVIQAKGNKKWHFVMDATGERRLEEISSHSVIIDPHNGALKFGRDSLSLTDPIALGHFLFEGMGDRSDEFEFKLLGGERFEVSSQDKRFHVVFVPSKRSQSAPFTSIRGVNAWTAPLGPMKAPFEGMFGLHATETAYLHQNRSDPVRVVTSPSFPVQHLPALDSALAKWNESLKAKVFYRDPIPQEMSLGDCFSSRTLCTSWNGPSVVAWTGLGGFSNQSFDPESGEILGGILSLSNSAGISLSEAPPEITQTYVSGKFDLDFAVSIYLRKNEFIGYRHPIPLIFVENIILHELGHFNGLSHNFAGSNRGSSSEPTESIMDYFPFSVVRKSSIGTLDRAVVGVIYGESALPENFVSCDDFDSSGGFPPNNSKKRANCKSFDVGDPAEWSIRLAKASGNDVFSIHPGGGEPLLNELGPFLTASGGAKAHQRRLVVDYLCSLEHDQSRIASSLEKEFEVNFVCP